MSLLAILWYYPQTFSERFANVVFTSWKGHWVPTVAIKDLSVILKCGIDRNGLFIPWHL